jgi:putative transposase
VDGACYHITHRCHQREFLFRFKKHRDLYCHYLFQAVKRYPIQVMDFIVTSNHIHLLLTAENGEDISLAMKFLHGDMAQHYNAWKHREGSFWTNRFHVTRIQNGNHLQRCLFYIDMNMVRAGVVSHPAEWMHCGCHEMQSPKQRYRTLDLEALLACLEFSDHASFLAWYKNTLGEVLGTNKSLQRQSFWSDSAAVGDPDWLEIAAKDAGLKRYEVVSCAAVDSEETEGLKSCFLRRKNEPKY